jgi:putative membrane protein
MAGGGVFYILLGALTVALFAYRTLGLGALLGFLIPAIAISLSSELLGTSTGFPFGHYSYLNGLGYKVAGLVPFTIPLSWFYLGFSAYLLARNGICQSQSDRPPIIKHLASILLGAGLLMSWDFVLDPAMSQTAMPFWYWHQPGAFFGMPYQNFAGWFGTGTVFMTVAGIIWRVRAGHYGLSRKDLTTPLAIYMGNFAFATVMSLAAGFWVPILLGILVGALPAWLLWQGSTATLTEEDGASPATSALGTAAIAPVVVSK